VQQSAVVSKGAASGLGLVDGANNGKGDSGLLMGDLNHDGKANDAFDLFFDLASAQILANSSVSGDARIILASQAVAAQLNDYNDWVYDQAHGGVTSGFTASPNGLISEAVQWLEGLGPLSSNGHSKVNYSTTNDLTSPAVQAIINDGTTGKNDYTLSGNAITFLSNTMSSSDASWQTKAQVFSEASAGIDVNGDHLLTGTVWANGEGLKNALEAYNTAKFVVSTDGTTIGWAGTPDTHANAPDVFWGILANHGVTGVEWHLA